MASYIIEGGENAPNAFNSDFGRCNSRQIKEVMFSYPVDCDI